MARIVINIPDEEYGMEIADKFQDFFKRIVAETDARLRFNDTLALGVLELQTAKMFMDVLQTVLYFLKDLDDWLMQTNLKLLCYKTRQMSLLREFNGCLNNLTKPIRL